MVKTRGGGGMLIVKELREKIRKALTQFETYVK